MYIIKYNWALISSMPCLQRNSQSWKLKDSCSAWKLFPVKIDRVINVPLSLSLSPCATKQLEFSNSYFPTAVRIRILEGENVLKKSCPDSSRSYEFHYDFFLECPRKGVAENLRKRSSHFSSCKMLRVILCMSCNIISREFI